MSTASPQWAGTVRVQALSVGGTPSGSSWISERRFLHALNYCMLLPGPEAQQLATYVGWLLHRTWGGIIAGVRFVLPSLYILIALSWIYIAYGEVPIVAGLFFGIKPAVTAIVVQRNSPTARRDRRPLAQAVAIALLRYKRGVIQVLMVCALVGLSIQWLSQ